MTREENMLTVQALEQIRSGSYEEAWERERKEAAARACRGRRLVLPETVEFDGQAWSTDGLEPLCYDDQTRYRGMVLLDIHGGGFVEGTPWADDALCAYYHERLGIPVVSLDYRKAPRYPYPVPLYDIAAQIIWLSRENPLGAERNRIVVMGHSAGGNLAAAYCLLAAKKGLAMPCAQVLDYPYLDPAADSLSRPQIPDAIDPLCMEVFRLAYMGMAGGDAPGRTGEEAAGDPLFSPARASAEEARGLPPALLVTCGRDSLCPEGQRYGRILEKAGVSLTRIHCAEACHAFIEHTFNRYSRFSIDEEQRRLAMEVVPEIAAWIETFR